MKQFRLITGASKGKLRSAIYLGREHLVVPIVALVEGVIQAVNSPGPELVLASEFSRAPQGWNGRPVMMDHPATGDERTSANEPRTLENSGLGQIFYTNVKDNKLTMEAWIDLERAETVEGGSDIVARVRGGEIVEVSVGVFVTEEQKKGTHNGVKYDAVWRDIVPDHLAILHAGTRGACNTDMGCGTRAAAQKEGDVSTAAVAPPKSMKSRFLEFLEKFRPSQEGTSDNELRESLNSLLRAVEPGFLGVDAVYPEDKKVVFAAYPGDTLQYFEIDYDVDASGVVALGSERTEVKMVTRFEPVVAAAASGCGCTKAAVKEESPMAVSNEKKARVAALVTRLAAKTKLVSASDGPLYENMSDERLAALEAEADEMEKEDTKAKPVTPKAPPSSPADPAPQPVQAPEQTPAPVTPTQPQTEEDYLRTAPESIKEIVTQHKAASAAKKSALVTSLKSAQSVYSETELNALPVTELEKIAKLVPQKRTDFAPMAPRAASADSTVAPAPPDLTERIRTMQGKAKN